MPRKTVSSAADGLEAWARLIRVSQAALRDVQADLKAAGFPPLDWYDALLELRRAGPAGLRPYALQDAMLLAQYNMSRLANRLVRAGLAERRPCAEDGRGHVLALTDEGAALLKRMWPAYRAAVETRFASKLTKKDAAQLSALLAKLG